MSTIYTLIKDLLVPRTVQRKRIYRRLTGKELDLKHPKDFNEKLQWLMVHMDARKMSVYADKIAVREYVRQKGHSDILTTLYSPENRGGGVQ